MALLNLSIDYRTLSRAARGAELAGQRLISNVTLASAGMVILRDAMRAEVPVKTGQLRDSITARGGITGGGLYGLGYGVYVRDGTKPHIITPKTAKMLRFTINGNVVFARIVHHPGTKPNRFDERTITRAEPALRVLLMENGRSLVRLMANPV